MLKCVLKNPQNPLQLKLKLFSTRYLSHITQHNSYSIYVSKKAEDLDFSLHTNTYYNMLMYIG
jgi:hypothetical protein